MYYTKYATIDSESALRSGDEGKYDTSIDCNTPRFPFPIFPSLPLCLCLLSRLSVQWNSVKCWTVANVNNRCMFRSDPLWTLAVFVDLADDDHSHHSLGQSHNSLSLFLTSFCNTFPGISKVQIYVNIWTACRNCSQMSLYDIKRIRLVLAVVYRLSSVLLI